MEQAINRKDIFSCFVSRKEELSNPLTQKQENELFNAQPLRVKDVPKLSKRDILGIFSKLPTYLAFDEPPKSSKSETVDENVVDVAAEETEEREAEQTDEPSIKENDEAEQEPMKENVDADVDVVAEKEIEPTEVLSFYDISRVVKKVRETRIKDLFRRSVTTHDPSKGPKQRSKALRANALKYTDNAQKHRLAECELSSVAEALLHTFTHEVVEMGQTKAAQTQGAQNVRLLRHLQKDNDTNWDANCCIRGSNRVRNHGK